MRRSGLIAAALLVSLGSAAPAQADVLVNAPSQSIACGGQIKTGVWYQSYSGGPRGATITIRSIGGQTLNRRRVVAQDVWRYFYYTPRCGRRYRVQYLVPGGKVNFVVRVRR
ncbi:MAG TPA: hypothetical protein VL120_00290 [Solirubrobacteraceae bacterium]|nr:hypothetical protein [Solirubrobacteraceae bacterium]